MDNIDEIAAYKNEHGSFDVIISLTQDGQPAKATFTNMHFSMDLQFDGSIRLVLEP